MKKIALVVAICFITCNLLFAQNTPVSKSNYQLAERFSAAKIGKMIYSRDVKPNWLKDGNSFWYAYATSDGVKYKFVDAKKASTRELFNHVKMAAELSKITGDPLVANRLKIGEIKFSDNGKTFRFSYQSKKEIDKKLSKLEKKKENEKKTKLESEKKEYKAPVPKKEMKKFYFNYNMSTGEISELIDYEPKKKYPVWASVSPDGKTIVFAKNFNLYYMDSVSFAKAIEDGKDTTIVEHQITKDGVDGFSYGKGVDNMTEKQLASFSKDRHPSYIYWSPDSKHFTLVKSDVRALKKLWVINSIGNPRPTLESYRYQMAGDKESPISHLYIFDNDTKKSKEVNISRYKDQMISITRAPVKYSDALYNHYNPLVWEGNNESFYISRTSRDHKRQDVSRVNITDSATVTVITNTEMNVSLEDRGVYVLNGEKEHIIRSERDGWAHLYLYGNNGEVKNQITAGEYHVDNILGVDEKNRVIFFTAKGVNPEENPYYEHLCSINFNGSGLKILNKGDFFFSTALNDNNEYFVSTYSKVDTAPKSALYNRKGRKILDLEVADLTELFESGYKFPERFIVKSADGMTDLYGVMYKPFDFDSTKLYPIIEYVYPGPQVEAVNETFSPGMTRVDQLAQLGFIVITVGNRGGHSVRSKWYHTHGYGNLRDYGLADKKRAIEQLAARHNYIDISKVGIHGHSGGGFMSTAAMFVYPDFFKVAVSCAGNHDNNIYNRWWGEKHNGVYEKISEKNDTSFVFKVATNPQLARNLKGKLFLIHGELDNNVHPAHTMRVVDALIKANKRFDMLLLPTQRHGFGNMNEYFFWKMADYFTEHLIGDSKMNETHIPQLSE